MQDFVMVKRAEKNKYANHHERESRQAITGVLKIYINTSFMN